MMLAAISPKKKANVGRSWYSSSQTKNLASVANETSTPIPMPSRKRHWIRAASSLNRNVNSSRSVSTPAISRNASVSRVNAPMMKSMVPPDTPGMTLAPPMQKPTEKWYRSSRNFKNVRTGTPLSGMELISFGRKGQARQDSNLI